MLTGGDIGFGESYMDGDWSSPDLVARRAARIRNLALLEDRNRAFSALGRWRDLVAHRRRREHPRGQPAEHPRATTTSATSSSASSSTGRWPTRAAVYRSADDSLEQAQDEKFDRICRKLRLGPRDHVLEIGTGWGGFAAWAATRYGCRVTTTTISDEQHAYAAGAVRAARPRAAIACACCSRTTAT